MRMHLAPRIISDPRVLSGKPVIEGTRVPVELVVGKLGGGMSFEDIAAEYEITREDILAALTYASSILSLEEVRGIA